MFNICYCNAMDGNPHDPDCPYPLYAGSLEESQRWFAAFDLKRNRRILDESLKEIINDYRTKNPED